MNCTNRFFFILYIFIYAFVKLHWKLPNLIHSVKIPMYKEPFSTVNPKHNLGSRDYEVYSLKSFDPEHKIVFEGWEIYPVLFICMNSFKHTLDINYQVFSDMDVLGYTVPQHNLISYKNKRCHYRPRWIKLSWSVYLLMLELRWIQKSLQHT